MGSNEFGDLLRSCRKGRRLSQLELALRAGISARHLSFLETGRSHPSQAMVLALAGVLDLPLRERNALLHRAGFAPAFEVSGLDAPQLASIRRRLSGVLERLNPNPTVLLDRHWNVLEQNAAAAAVLTRFIAEPAAFAPPLNLMRLLFAREGARAFITNWDEVASAMLQRLHRDAAAAPGDDAAQALLDECARLGARRALDAGPSPEPLVSLKLRRGELELALFTAITSVGTPLDVTLEELRLETFLPLDDRSDDVLRELVT